MISEIRSSDATNRAAATAASPLERPPTDPVDSVDLAPASEATATPPVSSPWEELAALGVLAGANGSGGPLHAVLGDSLRQDLLASLERLQDAGVTLRYDRRIGPHKTLTSGAALDRLAKATGEEPLRLEATAPDGTSMPVRGLTDLETLDYRFGAGESILSGRHRALARAIDGLRTAGYTVPRFAGGRSQDYGTLARYGEEFPPWVQISRSGGAEDSIPVNSVEQLLALNFMYGDGKDYGLARPVLAAGLRDLYARGMIVRNKFGGLSADPYLAWQELTQKDHEGAWVTGDRTWGPYVRAERWETVLADLDALERSTVEAVRLGESILVCPDPEARWDNFYRKQVMEAIDPLGARTTMEQAVVSFATVREAIDAHMKQQYFQENTQTMTRLIYRRLAERCASGSELVRVTQALAAEIRASGYLGTSQEETALEVGRLVEGVSPSGPTAGEDVLVGEHEVRIGDVTLPISPEA